MEAPSHAGHDDRAAAPPLPLPLTDPLLLLDDLLAIVDELELPTPPAPSSSSSSSPLRSPPSSPLSTPMTSPMPMLAAPPKKRRRRRQKEELEYLRGHVRELEDDLQRLRSETSFARAMRWALQQQQQQRRDSRPGAHNAPTGSRPVALRRRLRPAMGVWEELARGQKAAVRRSLMQNIQLRAVLEGQLSIARALEAALEQRQLTAFEVAPYLGDHESSVCADADAEERIFESLGQGLDALYAQVDTVITPWGCPVTATTSETHRTDVRVDAEGMYLEYRMHRGLPLPAHAVSRVAWRILCDGTYSLDTGFYSTHDRTEDTVSAKLVDTFFLPASSPREPIVMTTRVAMKRVVEATRAVFVWESLVETVGHVCLRQRERVWAIVRELPEERDDACEITACIRVRPEMVVSDVNEGMDIGLLTNVVVSTYQRNFGSMATFVCDELMARQAG